MQAQPTKTLIDHLESIIMTFKDYFTTMMTKATRKEVMAREQEEQKTQAKQRNAQPKEKKAHRGVEKVMH